jgi:hypothetical protein
MHCSSLRNFAGDFQTKLLVCFPVHATSLHELTAFFGVLATQLENQDETICVMRCSILQTAGIDAGGEDRDT